MTYIEFLIEEILSFLKHEREFYTRILESSPSGSLIIDRSRKMPKWLNCIPMGKDARGQRHYERKTITNDSALITKLADKEYARVALKLIDQNLQALNHVLQKMCSYSQDAVFEGMHTAYKALPRSSFGIFQRAQDVLHMQLEWGAKPYTASAYRPEEKIHTTSRGLNVRSRAELLIAEMLYKYDIPFRYEQVLYFGKYEVAPDFTFLDRDGIEFYWEYCGMMSLAHYRDRQVWKRGLYESAGITEWENMIYTYDVTDSIDMREIEAIIKTKVLPRMLPANQNTSSL